MLEILEVLDLLGVATVVEAEVDQVELQEEVEQEVLFGLIPPLLQLEQ